MNTWLSVQEYHINNKGITHVYYEDTEFLTIDEWEREYKLYSKLRLIDFFKKYKLWKNFFLWKRSMRRNAMLEC